MKHQKAVYLQEMGITHWQVRKLELFPQFYDPSQVDLSHFAILVISDKEDFQHPLMEKILSAFKFKKSQVFCCSMQEFENHQGSLPEYIWSTLGKVNQPNGHKLLMSPSIPILAASPEAKKSLWKQFSAFNL